MVLACQLTLVAVVNITVVLSIVTYVTYHCHANLHYCTPDFDVLKIMLLSSLTAAWFKITINYAQCAH